MQQAAQESQPTVEQLPWEAPELVIADVSTATQLGGLNDDGSGFGS